jgi:hypothetical protein
MIYSWRLEAERGLNPGWSLIRKGLSTNNTETKVLRECFTEWITWCNIYGKDRTAHRGYRHPDGPVNVRLTIKPLKHIRQPLMYESKRYVQIPSLSDDDWFDFRKTYRVHFKAYNWPR